MGRVLHALSAWFVVRDARDGESRRRAELVVLASSVWLLWSLALAVTVPVPRGFALHWLYVVGGSCAASALLLYLARRARTEPATRLFALFLFTLFGMVAWYGGPESHRMSFVIPVIALIGSLTEPALVLVFSVGLALVVAGLAAAEQLGLYHPLLGAIEPGWVPFLRQAAVVGALSVVLRHGYDRLERRVSERERASAAAVEAATAITASLEELVQQRTAALSSTRERSSRLAQRVADELGADLGVLRERLQAFLGAEKLLGPRLADVSDAAAAVDRLAVMLERLHQHAAFGAAALRPAAIDMEALTREVIAQYERGEGVNVEWRVGAMPRAWADPPLMRAVLENLVTNALKFSRGRSPARIELGFHAHSGCYFVRDNGVGFDPGLAVKLFAPFRRLHRDSEFEGYGVGLANVRRIVERSGGEVAITAEPERGAEVLFRVPLFVEGAP